MAKGSTSRREFWISHLNKWRVQGGTMKAYAQANDLAVGSLYEARRRARAGERAQEQPAPSGVSFLPVRVAREAREEAVRVRLPNGIVVTVPLDVESSAWSSVRELFGTPK